MIACGGFIIQVGKGESDIDVFVWTKPVGLECNLGYYLLVGSLLVTLREAHERKNKENKFSFFFGW